VVTVRTSRAGIAHRYSEGLQAGRLGFDSHHGQGFSHLHSVQTALGSSQPPIQWVLGALSEGKAAGGPPSSANVKNGGAVIPLPNMSS
jgi:hypothetical protein